MFYFGLVLLGILATYKKVI